MVLPSVERSKVRCAKFGIEKHKRNKRPLFSYAQRPWLDSFGFIWLCLAFGRSGCTMSVEDKTYHFILRD